MNLVLYPLCAFLALAYFMLAILSELLLLTHHLCERATNKLAQILLDL